MAGPPAVSKYLSDDELTELISVFPAVDFAFAYGSGVIRQQGYAESVSSPDELPMLDLVFGVNDSEQWHKSNLARNRSHYSGLARVLGERRVTSIQEGFGAKLYYNALVPMPATSHRGRSMKYGVINMDHLKTDLKEWTWLYTAGRLHKPVRVIQDCNTAVPLLADNLVSAVKVALLLLPEHFSAQEFYTAIAGLSYTGDFRMYFGENPDKVKNIVINSLGAFQDLYAPAVKDIPGLVATGHDSAVYAQDISPGTRATLAKTLPHAVRGHLQLRKGAPTADAVTRALAAVVSRSSLRQGVKGVLTAGFVKSASYSLAKVTRAMEGQQKRRQL